MCGQTVEHLLLQQTRSNIYTVSSHLVNVTSPVLALRFRLHQIQREIASSGVLSICQCGALGSAP